MTRPHPSDTRLCNVRTNDSSWLTQHTACRALDVMCMLAGLEHTVLQVRTLNTAVSVQFTVCSTRGTFTLYIRAL